jgi:hypothetical protein
MKLAARLQKLEEVERESSRLPLPDPELVEWIQNPAHKKLMREASSPDGLIDPNWPESVQKTIRIIRGDFCGE